MAANVSPVITTPVGPAGIVLADDAFLDLGLVREVDDVLNLQGRRRAEAAGGEEEQRDCREGQ